MKYAVWDRVTGNSVDLCETREQAEASVEAMHPYEADFIILEEEEDAP